MEKEKFEVVSNAMPNCRQPEIVDQLLDLAILAEEGEVVGFAAAFVRPMKKRNFMRWNFDDQHEPEVMQCLDILRDSLRTMAIMELTKNTHVMIGMGPQLSGDDDDAGPFDP